MKKGLFLLFFCALSSVAMGHSIINKTNPLRYKITVQTIVKHWGIGYSNTDLFLAYLGSNEYQKYIYCKLDNKAKVVNYGSAGDSCIHYNLALGKGLESGKKVTLRNEFIVEVADVSVDFNALDTIYAYDHCDPNYEKYTGSNFPFIDVGQRYLYKVSALIWESSEDQLDYAKKCYQYVAKTFQYGLPLSGFKSLNFTLKNRMGDCGNLSSVLITLLRMRDIPARHLIGFRPDGSLHVWADFYMANYGWIPVDVTYKHDFPDGNFFGNIKFEDSGFIVQRGIGHEVSVLNSPMRITGLQTYTYSVAYSNIVKSEVSFDRKVSCQMIQLETK